MATHQLPENEAFVGRPLTRGAKLAIVRQRYDATDAALLLFELRPPLRADPTAAELAAVDKDSRGRAEGESSATSERE